MAETLSEARTVQVTVKPAETSRNGNPRIEMESMSKPGKFYTITYVVKGLKEGQQPELFCDCPSYIYQKAASRKPCKHLKALSLFGRPEVIFATEVK